MEAITKKQLKLLATSPSADRVMSQVKEYFFGTNVESFVSMRFVSRIGVCYDIYNTKGLLNYYVIIKHNDGVYRFYELRTE